MKCAVALSALVALTISASAYAAQITGGDSAAGVYDFQNGGPGSITIASQGLAGIAFFPTQLPGAYTLGPILPAVPAGPLVGGNFPTDGHQAVSITVGPFSLTGDFHFDLIKDHSSHPDILGSLAIATSTFPDFAPGSVADMDVTLTYGSGVQFLDELALTGGDGTWETISTFEIISRVIEPSTLFLLGCALIGLGVLHKVHVRPGAKNADEHLAATSI